MYQNECKECRNQPICGKTIQFEEILATIKEKGAAEVFVLVCDYYDEKTKPIPQMHE